MKNAPHRTLAVLAAIVSIAGCGGESHQDLRTWMLDLCDVHTLLRLPVGLFYAQGVKTNVLFLTRGQTDKASTKTLWVYDMRANAEAFGKTRPFSREDCTEFEKSFGPDPYGRSKRKDQGVEGRWRPFTRQELIARGDNLNISWLRDESDDPEDEMTEPHELAAAIAGHLRTALEEIEAITEELPMAGDA